MREKIGAPAGARYSDDSAGAPPARRAPMLVRVPAGLVALLVGLWLSAEFAMIAMDLGGADGSTPWERLYHVRRPLVTSVLYGVLAIAGFRGGLRWRPWSWWLSGAAVLPAWAAGVVLDWI